MSAPAVSAVSRQDRLGWRAFVPWLLSLVVLLAIPMLTRSGTTFTVLNVIAINIVFALSYNMQLGQAGLFSFGHAVFYGFGGYAAIHAMNAIEAAGAEGTGFWAGFPVYALPLVGMAAGVIAAFVIGWPFCRRGGIAFAMITLGLGELIAAGSEMFPSIFGGEPGVYGNRMVGPVWFGLELAQPADVYWFMAFWVFVAALAMWAFTRTPLGRMSNAVRDNAERIRFIGYSPHNIRFLVFIVSSGFAGLAGGMTAVNYEIMTPNTMGLLFSGMVLLMAAIGGLGMFYGPIVGAILFTVMNSLLSDYTNASVFYIGLVFLVIVMFAPDGLAGGIEKVRQSYAAGSLLKSLPGWAGGALGSVFIALGLITLMELGYQGRYGQARLAQVLGLDFNPYTLTGWVIMVVLLIVGYGILRIVRKHQEAEQ